MKSKKSIKRFLLSSLLIIPFSLFFSPSTPWALSCGGASCDYNEHPCNKHCTECCNGTACGCCNGEGYPDANCNIAK